MRTFALILMAFALYVTAEDEVMVPRDVTIDAAFRYNGNLFLISGDEYMAVSPDGFEKYLKARTGDSEVPITEDIQAAVNWPHKPLVYFYGNDTSYKTNQSDLKSKVRTYGKKAKRFLQDGGPDAAAFKDGYFYIFRGCEFVAQKGTLWHLGEPQNVTDYGLPCDIDAAWADDDLKGMTLLKGDSLWYWGSDAVVGPTPFEDEYTIWSWQLTPTPDERFTL